ncbi:DUF3849 domain-containing protein [Mediterraneibacter gnavus]|uniref:DUF3849 domain-containing protein n=1 Tax=Mediterraneibacter gnavus TaxID=33038 RepID=UPI0032B87A2B
MREKEIINDMEKENRLFDGNGEHYGIYQLKKSEERTYQFMGMREASSFGFEIHGEDYELIYSDRLGMEDTLNSLYEKFNINHPQDFTGHSLSVSDVVVMRKNGESKAYYVDSFGFTELPEFIHERLRLQEVSVEEKREQKGYLPVYQQTLQYAMEHGAADDYLDSRKLNIDCKKAIEDTIKEHFDGMRLSLEDSGGVLEQFGTERVSYVLANTLRHLSEDGRFSRDNRVWADGIEVTENIHRGMDMNLDYLVNSHPAVLDGYIHLVRGEIRMLDVEKKMGISHVTEQTSGLMVEGHMGTWHTIGQQEYHGERFFLMRHDEYGSEVADIIVSENGTLVAEDLRNGFDAEAGFAISEYLEGNGASVYDLKELPAGTDIVLYDGKELYTEKTQPIINDSWGYSMVGIDENGEEYRFNFNEIYSVATEKGLRLKMPELHYIDHYYVVEDLQKQGKLDIWEYSSLSEALENYFALPTHKMKALGIQNQSPLPGSLDFIQCKNGVDHLTEDWIKVTGWLNPQIYQTVQYLKESLEVHETQIAYDTGIGFFAIQHTDGGYDYTFYDKDYLEKDGGVYDDPEFTIEEAAGDLLAEEGISIHDCKVTDYEELMECVENAEKEQQAEPSLTYYVAECMEFSVLGEYHADLTIDEAFDIYKRIPSDRMNGGKGIGICLQEDSLYAGEYPLMRSNQIDMETLEGIPYMKNHPLVQQAVKEMEQRGVKLWYPIKEAQAEKGMEQRQEQPQRESKKESVLKALKERQERLKAQQTEPKRPERSQSKKKGDMEL